jgi:hypothetical protein
MNWTEKMFDRIERERWLGEWKSWEWYARAMRALDYLEERMQRFDLVLED